MLRNRLPLVVLNVCFWGAAPLWADDLGYIDCTNHPEDTQVAAKAAKTQEVVGSMPCGERFAILQSGFFFTRIQTKEGKIGYVYTNLISRDYSANAAPAPQVAQAPVKMAARSSNPISSIAAVFKPKAAPPAQMRLPAPPAASPTAGKANTSDASAAVAEPTSSSTVAQATPSASAPPQPATKAPAAVRDASGNSLFPAKSSVIVLNDTVPPADASVKPNPTTPESAARVKVGENFSIKRGGSIQSDAANPTGAHGDTASSTRAQTKSAAAPGGNPPVVTIAENFPAKSAVVVENEKTTAAQSQPAADQAGSVSVAAMASSPQPDTTSASPEPNAAAPPEPTPAQPTAESFRAEPPNPALQKRSPGHSHIPGIELFGGYTFARMNNGAGLFTNYSGGMGAFGLNVRPWLQAVADSSYNMIQNSTTKVILYGNHYGPRLFWRRSNRWNLQPFVEGLFGGSRIDTTVSGTGGYSVSSRVFSFKAGGGLDIRPSRHIEVRLFDADYYRTSFAGGTTPYQSNYWISTGVVIRLFGGAE